MTREVKEERAQQLRALLDAAYGQCVTVRGEQHNPTGTRVSVMQLPGDVAGDVVGEEADAAPGASAGVHQQATTVQPGGSLAGFKETPASNIGP